MTPFAFTDETIHVVLVAFSSLVLTISVLAYLDRRNRRYMFLSLAFSLLTASQVVVMIESLFYSSQLILIPATQIHLSHFLDFLMLSSFSAALLIGPRERIGNRRDK